MNATALALVLTATLSGLGIVGILARWGKKIFDYFVAQGKVMRLVAETTSKQLTPNGGSSMLDQVNATNKRLEAADEVQAAELAKVHAALAELTATVAQLQSAAIAESQARRGRGRRW